MKGWAKVRVECRCDSFDHGAEGHGGRDADANGDMKEKDDGDTDVNTNRRHQCTHVPLTYPELEDSSERHFNLASSCKLVWWIGTPEFLEFTQTRKFGICRSAGCPEMPELHQEPGATNLGPQGTV